MAITTKTATLHLLRLSMEMVSFVAVLMLIVQYSLKLHHPTCVQAALVHSKSCQTLTKSLFVITAVEESALEEF